MSSLSRYFRIPRPTRFLYFFSLSSGCEIALMTLLINKLSGILGVFGIFSGGAISSLQLSMYFYSLIVFTTLCLLTSEIRKRLPFATIAFAYLYLFDSAVNIAYTVAFGFEWFAVLSDTYGSDPKGNAPSVAPSAGNATVTLTSPVEVVERDTAGIVQPESATSIFIISLAWAIRFYLMFVVFAHAREVVRKSATPGEAPFEGSNNSEGWRGKLGRAMVNVGRGYWEGESWMAFADKRRDTNDRRRFRGLRLGSLDV